MFSALEETLRNGRFGVLLRHLIGKPGSLRAHLVKHTTGVFALKVASTLLAFVTSVILARLLGAAGYGIYAYVWSVITFLSIPATFGLPQLLVRNIASYQTKGEWGHIKGLLHFADRTVLTASPGIAVLLGLGVWLLSGRIGTQTMYTFFIALPLLLFTALLQMRQMALWGLNRIVQGEMLISFVRPVLFVLLVAGTFFLLGRINPASAIGMQVAAFGIAFLGGMLLLKKYLPRSVQDSSTSFEKRAWVRSALPLLVVGVFGIINQQAPILLLGPLKGAEAVGIYKVAFQITTLISSSLMVVNTAIAPTLSTLYVEGDKQRLQKVVTNATRVASLPAFVLALVFIGAGGWVLGILFGEEFSGGAMALAILSVGNLVNVAMGPAGLLLNMTNYERVTAWGVGAGAGVSIILSAIFIPILGIVGAAIAASASMIVWNLILANQVSKKIEVNPTILGDVKLKREKG